MAQYDPYAATKAFDGLIEAVDCGTFALLALQSRHSLWGAQCFRDDLKEVVNKALKEQDRCVRLIRRSPKM
jgi:hypothetical protein